MLSTRNSFASPSSSSQLPSKQNQPSTSSPRTTASNRRRLGNLFASFGIPGSPLRRAAGPSSSESQDGPRSSPSARSKFDGVESRGVGKSFADKMAELTLGTSGSGQVREPGPCRDVGKKKVDDWDWDEGCFVDTESVEHQGRRGEGGCKLLELPDEILLQILLFLPPTISQLRTISLISTHFCDLAQAPILWARTFDATSGYRLSDEAKERAVAVLHPPRGLWDGLSWADSPPESDSSHQTKQVIDPLDSEEIQPGSEEDVRPDEIAIHYPTLYRSRHTLAQHIRSASPHILTLAEHTDSVYCVHLVGRWLITGSRDKTIRVWNLPLCAAEQESETGPILVHTVNAAHEGSVLGLKFDLDQKGKGKMISGSSDCTAKIWEVDFGPTGISIKHLTTFRDHTGSVLDVEVSASHYITCSKDATIRIYDRESRMCLHTLTGHVMPVNCLAVKGEEVVSASGDGSWRIWDLKSGSEVRRGGGEGRGLACIAWKDDYVVTGDNDHLVKLYDANTGRLIRTFDGHSELVRTVALDPQAGLVISGSYDKSVRLWDMHTGQLIKNLDEFHHSLVFDVQMTVNRLISA
nr:uncharacterized protein CI109_000365 [Kwoniella shandongensis]KAA5531523.1 hypothetical protein CI109_000365 [Kwoniella shandongensis]